MRRKLPRWLGASAAAATAAMIGCGSQVPTSETVLHDTVGCALAVAQTANADVEAHVYRLSPQQAQELARVWGGWGLVATDITSLDANRLSTLLPFAENAMLESVPTSHTGPEKCAVLRPGVSLDTPDAGSQIAVEAEAFGGGWVARVSYQEVSMTHDGRRQVRRSETRVAIDAPMAILSVDAQRLYIVGVGTSVEDFVDAQRVMELAAR